MVVNTVAVLQRENARLQAANEELDAENQKLRAFLNVLNTLAIRAPGIVSNADLLPVLDETFNAALDLLDAPSGSVLLLDDETGELQFVLVRGPVGADLVGYRIPGDAGIAGWVLRHKQAALVRDVRRDARFSSLVDESFQFHTQSIAAAPLMGNGQILGVIEALNQASDEPFSETDLNMLRLICFMAGEILINIERIEPGA